VVPVTVDDLAANDLLDDGPPVCWQRSVEAVRARKDDLTGLAVASDERIEAYVLHAGGGEIVSLRPLVEDGSVSSSPTSIFNARLGYVFDNGLKLQVDGFNIFNTQASQIDYYYQSQLRNEAAPVNDIHFHPVEPLAFRFTIAKAF